MAVNRSSARARRWDPIGPANPDENERPAAVYLRQEVTHFVPH
jgi:hypothetical protein